MNFKYSCNGNNLFMLIIKRPHSAHKRLIPHRSGLIDLVLVVPERGVLKVLRMVIVVDPAIVDIVARDFEWMAVFNRFWCALMKACSGVITLRQFMTAPLAISVFVVLWPFLIIPIRLENEIDVNSAIFRRWLHVWHWCVLSPGPRGPSSRHLNVPKNPQKHPGASLIHRVPMPVYLVRYRYHARHIVVFDHAVGDQQI